MEIGIISDTHTLHNNIENIKMDMLIHAGDFSHNKKDLYNFLEWFEKTDVKYRILIAGNNDKHVYKIGKEKMKNICEDYGVIYLEDEQIEIEGLKIYGSPWVINYKKWNFAISENELKEKWKMIPDDVDILITHSPAYKICDQNRQGVYCGSITLKERIKSLKKLKLHCVGHIHDAYGHNKGLYVTINGSMLGDKRSFKKPIQIIEISNS